jgi:hypothetical protein
MLLVPLKAQLVISILDFEGEGLSKNILRASYKKLEAKLFETRRFTITAKDIRDDILKEAEFQYSGQCADDCLVELGKQLGADYLVGGEIIDLIDSYQLNISITDIEEGTLFSTVETMTGHNTTDILNGVEKLALEMTRRIASGSEPQQIMQQTGLPQTAQKTYGSLKISSNPPGAIILIDGDGYGVTPSTISELESGDYNLILDYQNFISTNETIMVERDTTIIIDRRLTPQTGSLSIKSNPSGATVYIDDSPRGETPFEIPQLPVNSYMVRLELERYQSSQRRATVQYNIPTREEFTLAPLPGKLVLTQLVEGVTIYINNEKYTNNSGVFTKSLPVGRYKIEITKKGYYSFEKEILIQPKGVENIPINLRKTPAEKLSNLDNGFLTVNTFNKGLRLKIPGVKESQELPMQYFELKYGSYSVQAFGEKFESKKVNVDIERQKTKTIAINLQKKQKAKALRYSLMFPGGGQLYTGSKSKVRGYVYAATFLGTGALFGQGIFNYSDDTKLLDQYQANYQAASSAADIDATWALYEQQSATVNDAQTGLMILSTTLVSAWLTSIIDSYFFSGL